MPNQTYFLADNETWEETTERIMDRCKFNNINFKKWILSKSYLKRDMFCAAMWRRCYNIVHSVVKRDNDHFIVISGKEGCITGDTEIDINRCSLGRKYTIKHIYNQYHRRNNKYAHKMWDLKYPTFVRSYDGKSIRLHKIKDVVYSGIKEVWKLELENGRFIKATKDHKIMTKNGWIELQNLTKKDEVMCDTLNQGIPVYSKVKSIDFVGKEKTYDIVCEEPNHNFVANGMVIHNSGKSTFAIQLACVLDTNLNLSKLLYEPSNFIKKIRDSKPGDCLVLDEGNLFLFSRESMGSNNKFMVKLFAIMRQKNIIIIINVPNFFTLDSYVRDHRTDTLVYVHERGQFRVFVRKAIQIISKKGHKYKQIAGVKVPMTCTFPGYFIKPLPVCVDREEYLKHKKDNFESFLQDVNQSIKTFDPHKKSEFITISEAQKTLPLSHKTIVKLINEDKIKGQKVGGRWLIDRVAFLEKHGKS